MYLRRLLAFFALLAIHPGKFAVMAQSPSQAPSRKTETLSPSLEWKASLGPYAAQGVFRLTVCPDASSYLSDGLGRILQISPSGILLSDQQNVQGLVATLALACDSRNRLHALNPLEWSVWTPSGSGLTRTSSINTQALGITPTRLVLDSDDKAYALCVNRQLAGSADLVLLEQSPGVASKVSLRARRGLAARADIARHTMSKRGSIARNPATGEILFLPLHPAEAQVFRSIDLGFQRQAPLWPPAQANPPLDSEAVPAEETLFAAYLDGGRILIQSIEPIPGDGIKTRKAFFLTELDSASLAVRVKQRLPSAIKGVLQGASSDGAAYFLSVSPKTGIQVYRARL
jgi:hypothetical protein